MERAYHIEGLSLDNVRILQAWLESGRRLGNFLTCAALLDGRGLGAMTDEELAQASEEYLDWLRDTGRVTLP